MRRTILFTATLATAAGLLAAGAIASEDDRTAMRTAPAEWMSVAALAQKLEAQGYTVREIERDDGYYEVEMTDPNGMRVEAYLDPLTGDPVDWDDD